jgi:hypothetical protein
MGEARPQPHRNLMSRLQVPPQIHEVGAWCHRLGALARLEHECRLDSPRGSHRLIRRCEHASRARERPLENRSCEAFEVAHPSVVASSADDPRLFTEREPGPLWPLLGLLSDLAEVADLFVRRQHVLEPPGQKMLAAVRGIAAEDAYAAWLICGTGQQRMHSTSCSRCASQSMTAA